MDHVTTARELFLINKRRFNSLLTLQCATFLLLFSCCVSCSYFGPDLALRSQEARHTACSISSPLDDTSTGQTQFVLTSTKLRESLIQSYQPEYREALQAYQNARSDVVRMRARQPIVAHQPGDRFPILTLSPRGGSEHTLRLDPHMRRHSLDTISRIALAPTEAHVALIVSTSEAPHNAVLIVDTRTLSSKLLTLDAHDVLWRDSEHLIVSVREDGQPSRVYDVTIGDIPQPRLTYSTARQGDALLVSKSRDDAFIFIEHRSPATSSIVIFGATDLVTPVAIRESEPHGARCAATQDSLVCLSYKRTPFGEIVRMPRSNLSAQSSILMGSRVTPLVNIDASGDTIVAVMLRGTSSELWVLDQSSSSARILPADGPVTTFIPVVDPAEPLRLKVRTRSFLQESKTISIDQLHLRDSFTPYRSQSLCPRCSEESLSAPAHDGVEIPISVVKPHDISGLVVIAYGAYGVSSHPEFSPYLLSLVQRGIAVAIAHIRGGGERGPSWHTAAIGSAKPTSVRDLIDATKYLQQHLKVSPHTTLLAGRSAGGWVTSHAANSRPDLYTGLILEAPFIEVHNDQHGARNDVDMMDRFEWGVQPTTLDLPPSSLPQSSLPLDVLMLVPLKDERIPAASMVSWGHRTFCRQRSDKSFFLSIIPNGRHDGPSTEAEVDAWMATREVFIRRAVTTRYNND